jgi:hypothetical protein
MDGCKIRFWEDVWIGISSLAIQYWELYCLINEQNKSITELWDETDLRYTFRRCVTIRLFQLWEEVVSIAESIELSPDEDEMVWQFHSSGVYSSQSLYGVINFWGVTLVFLPAVWKLITPSNPFLWLVSQNRILTRDNLSKRRVVDDHICLFCNEPEIDAHLLLEYVVATRTWDLVSQVVRIEIGSGYESIARL